MNSVKQVIAAHPEYKTLINRVHSLLSDSIEDVNRHGISGGYSGFIYYSETLAFYRRYRKLINRLAFDTAEMLGEDAVNMVANFRCVNDDAETRQDIGRCLYFGNMAGLNDDTHVPNALAWFAAEQVCRWFEDEI